MKHRLIFKKNVLDSVVLLVAPAIWTTFRYANRYFLTAWKRGGRSRGRKSHLTWSLVASEGWSLVRDRTKRKHGPNTYNATPVRHVGLLTFVQEQLPMMANSYTSPRNTSFLHVALHDGVELSFLSRPVASS